MWELWKNQFVQCVDKHAPLKTKRVGAKRSPWINNELVSLMRKRDYLKKKATKDKSSEAWDQFKQARNQTNNAIREAKRQYFSKNLEEHKINPRKTWSLINELSSRQRKSTTVSEVKVEGKPVTSSKDMSHAFNSHFISIGEKLAAEIPSSSLQPESFINRTNKIFTLKPPSINKTIKLLSKTNERKATGLDKIPCKLLKMAANIVAPSLSKKFDKSIHSGIFPADWKLARVFRFLKKAIKPP